MGWLPRKRFGTIATGLPAHRETAAVEQVEGERIMIKKKMAKRIMVTMAAAVFAVSLAGCGKSETTTTAAPQTEAAATTESAEVDDPLSFVKSGEIFFDNQLEATISVDGKKLEGNSAALKKGMSVSLEGLDPNVEIDLVMVYKSSDNTSGKSMVVFASGVDHEKLDEYLSKRLSSDMGKACLCFYKTGGKWNTNLSEKMNKLIEEYLPADTEEN